MDELQSNPETLHLLSIPGMRESIREGLDQELSESSKELDWRTETEMSTVLGAKMEEWDDGKNR